MARTQAQSSRPNVVVIGGGFAGLNAVKSLHRAPVAVTLIDRQNYHLFQPLLYQVATAALNPSDIAYPLRSAIRRQENASVLLADAKSIDLDRNAVHLDNGELHYDYLIVATGATHSYFGHDEWETNAPGLKTIEDALEIRRRIYLAYEAAERESDPEKRRSWLTFVVVGGGPTGVELAGALAEIGRQTLARDFRSIDSRSVRVLLVEGQEHILTTYPESLSVRAQKQLEKLGVEVRLSTMAKHIDDTGVTIDDERIQSQTVLWAAGVRASELLASLKVETDKAGRVVVERDLSIPGHPNAFVCGDAARVEDESGLVPGVSQAAIQQGKFAADAIRRLVSGKSTTSFSYHDKGSLATIGRGAAVADIGRLHFSGFPAWMAWLLVHIFFLIGFRNRLWVLSGWAWSYLTFQRGARLITGRHPFDALPEIRGDRGESQDDANGQAPDDVSNRSFALTDD